MIISKREIENIKLNIIKWAMVYMKTQNRTNQTIGRCEMWQSNQHCDIITDIKDRNKDVLKEANEIWKKDIAIEGK